MKVLAGLVLSLLLQPLFRRNLNVAAQETRLADTFCTDFFLPGDEFFYLFTDLTKGDISSFTDLVTNEDPANGKVWTDEERRRLWELGLTDKDIIQPPPDKTVIDRMQWFRDTSKNFAFFRNLLTSVDRQDTCISYAPIVPQVFGIQGLGPLGDEQILSHHLHIKIPLDSFIFQNNLKNLNEGALQMIIVQADSDLEGGAGFGQFLSPRMTRGLDKKDMCGDGKDPTTTSEPCRLMNEDLFFPCKFHQSTEHFFGNLFVWTRNAERKEKDGISFDPNNLGVLKLFWRFNSHTVCNAPKYVVFKGFVVNFMKPAHATFPPKGLTLADLLNGDTFEKLRALHDVSVYRMVPIQVNFFRDIVQQSPSWWPDPNLFHEEFDPNPNSQDYKPTIMNIEVSLNNENIPWVKDVVLWEHFKEESAPTAKSECGLQSRQCYTSNPVTEKLKLQCRKLEQDGSANTNSHYFGCGKKTFPSCRPSMEEPAKPYREHPHHQKKHPEYPDYVVSRRKHYCRCSSPTRLAEPEPSVFQKKHKTPFLYRPRDRNRSDIQAGATRRTTPKPKVFDPEIIEESRGLELELFPVRDVWNFRLIHGLLSTFSVVFLTPLSVFVARHYKETFMWCRMMQNVPWFVVHVHGLFLSLFFHLIGLFAVHLGKRIVGTNISGRDESETHKSWGYTLILLFSLVLLLGGIRPFNRRARKIVILLHWMLGHLLTFVGFYIILNTVSCLFGSPATLDQKYGDQNWTGFDAEFGFCTAGQGNYTEFNKKFDDGPYFVLINQITHNVLSWLSVYLLFNIGMDVIRCCTDYQAGISRKWFSIIVPLPALNEYNQTDTTGNITRTCILVLFLGSAVFFCGFVFYLLIMPFAPLATMGMTTCTHDRNNNFSVDAIMENCNFTMMSRFAVDMKPDKIEPPHWLVDVLHMNFSQPNEDDDL